MTATVTKKVTRLLVVDDDGDDDTDDDLVNDIANKQTLCLNDLVHFRTRFIVCRRF